MTEIDFRKSISGKLCVWLCCKIRSNWKCFQFDRKISQKRLKLISVVIFTSNRFLPSFTRTSPSHMHCSVKPSLRRNHPHRRTTIAISPVTGTAPIDVDHDRDRADRRRSRSSKSARLRSRSRRSRAKRRSTLRVIAIEIGEIEIAIAIAISPRKYAVLLGFIWVFRNEWHYVFVWELRKCEKIWATSKKCVFYGIFKNTTKHQKIFSEIFFEMQPNTWKHFLFRKCFYTNQTQPYFLKLYLPLFKSLILRNCCCAEWVLITFFTP